MASLSAEHRVGDASGFLFPMFDAET